MNTLQQRAEKVIPSGVNSPVRAFKNVNCNPLYATSAKGAYLTVHDREPLIDYCLSFGPMILGHAHPKVIEAIQTTASRGTSFAVTTELEIEMAERLVASSPALDKVRLVNSGTEAVMTALRLARGFTNRKLIVKFSGCYHGHVDSMLVEAGSGVAGLSEASSAGVCAEEAKLSLIAPYNDFESITQIFKTHGEDIAAIIVEPVAANMGLVQPKEGFLAHLRALSSAHNSLLIFDEVITGFRLQYGTYSNRCGFRPDLTCLGKIIGGGLPIGALGGRSDIMDLLAPNGPVYQAGTLSGNPISVAAGLATLTLLEELKPYASLTAYTEKLTQAVLSLAKEKGLPLAIPTQDHIFSLFFMKACPTNFDEVLKTDKSNFLKVYSGLLKAGIYLPPSPFETSFVSTEHDTETLEKTIKAFASSFEAMG